MDTVITAPPLDSVIVIDADEGGRHRISWSTPHGGGVGRWAGAAFLSFWLCGWLLGEVMAIGAVTGLLGGGAQNGGAAAGSAFLLVWLGGWTVGGLMAMTALYSMVRPPLPEYVVLSADLLEHNPGFFHAVPTGWQRRNTWSNPWPKSRFIPRERVSAVRLDFAADRQRLTLDVGADRVEVGRGLREPEREWLADVLRAWAGR